MNIAHLLPASIHFPLQKHSGRYEWVLHLAGMQLAAGHEVTIYCAAGSSSEPLAGIHWASLPSAPSDPDHTTEALLRLALANRRHDIFHSHLDNLHYTVADSTDKPIVFTQHWFPDHSVAEAVRLNTHRNVWAVPITTYMEREDSRLGIPHADVIYHGINLSLFKLSSSPRNDRLLFVGRIAPHKGVREAVKLAMQFGEKLDLVGKINTKDTAYWNEIEPFVDGKQIRYLGPKTQIEVAQLLGTAKAMLFLPQHNEAFGQTIIEAQACGTPVILNDVGANAQLCRPGKTGFVITHDRDYKTALSELSSISPADCRAFAELFDGPRMAQAYDALYERLLG